MKKIVVFACFCLVGVATGFAQEGRDSLWTKAQSSEFRKNARVIEVFKQDLEFVQSLRRVMGRAPEYSSPSGEKAEKKVLSDIAASYYDALKNYSENTSQFLNYFTDRLEKEALESAYQVEDSAWSLPKPNATEFDWLSGAGHLVAAGAAGAGLATDNPALTAGAVLGSELLELVTGIPGVNQNATLSTVDVVRSKDGRVQEIGEYAKKIQDLSVQIAVSRTAHDETKASLKRYKMLVAQIDSAAQNLEWMMSILSYGTNEAAYMAIQKVVRDGKSVPQSAEEVRQLAEALRFKSAQLSGESRAYLLPSLPEKYDRLSARAENVRRFVMENQDILELMLDTAKNIEIVQFYLSNR
ncbi:MAG: hypothetical protein HGB19_12505 [Chlorobiales bacterium]|nr:hypothetical protein [Chlorobiales bacterium]